MGAHEDQAKQFAVRFFNFMTKVLNDPGVITKDPGEYNAILAGVRLLNVAIPGMIFDAAQAAALFKALAAKNAATAGKLRREVNRGIQPAGVPIPYPNAPSTSLSEADLEKSNRMFEMFSKIMANSHEMKKAIIGNLPR